MPPQDGRQIDLRQDVAVEDEDGVVEVLLSVLDGPGCPEWHRFHDIAEPDAERSAVPEEVLDAAGLVVQAENDLVDLGNLPEQVELVAEKWSIEDRDDRLRCVKGQRAKARAFPPGEENGLHAETPAGGVVPAPC